MNTITFEIRNILVKNGVEEKDAEYIASEILTKTEARETLVTKADLYRVAMTQTGVTIAGIGVLLAIFNAL